MGISGPVPPKRTAESNTTFVLESDVSHVQRLLTTDRIFFVTANLLPAKAPLADNEFPLITDAIDESRRLLHFLLCGYVLMPGKP